jgi:hypothetical protein
VRLFYNGYFINMNIYTVKKLCRRRIKECNKTGGVPPVKRWDDEGEGRPNKWHIIDGPVERLGGTYPCFHFSIDWWEPEEACYFLGMKRSSSIMYDLPTAVGNFQKKLVSNMVDVGRVQLTWASLFFKTKWYPARCCEIWFVKHLRVMSCTFVWQLKYMKI